VSDFGGYYDIVVDHWIYCIIPVALAVREDVKMVVFEKDLLVV
jgi:phosphatidylglycerophosphate synthase